MPDSPVIETNIGEHCADERANAGFFDLPFHPSRQSHLVVLERDGTGHRLAAAQRAFLREVGDQLVGHAMRNLIRLRAMRIQPDDGADDPPDCLAAERWGRVHDDHASSELCGFEGRGHAGDASAEDADVCRQ